MCSSPLCTCAGGAVPAAATGGDRGRGASAERSLEALLTAGGILPADQKPAVVRRAYQRYAAMLMSARADGDAARAVDAYSMAAALPSLTTAAQLLADGISVNGPLYEGSVLTRCFRGRFEHVLKPLDVREYERARAFAKVVADSPPVPFLTSFELHVSESGKHFMMMPMFGSSLEHLPSMSSDDALLLWLCMSSALRGLHALGFAHMDVKPANICVAGAQGFMLIDIGSVTRYDDVTATTAPYVALDFPGAMRRSSARADWWLLAMTLAEKACGVQCLDVGARAAPTMGVLAARLREHLPPAIWRELEAVLELDAA